MNSLKGRPHVFWPGLAVLILVAEAAFSFSTLTSFTAAQQWSAHSHEVLRRIESLLVEMDDAETGQRGYLLTGSERYLEPYQTALQTLPGQFEELRNLTSDSPQQQTRIETLHSLATEKLATLKIAIDLRRTRGVDEAIAAVLTGGGKQLMDQIRIVIQEMKTSELSVLEERNRQLSGTQKFLTLLLICGAVFLSLVLLAGSRAIGLDQATKAQAEEERLAAKKQYKTLFESMTEGFGLFEIICDGEGRPRDCRRLAVNPAFETHCGIKAVDVLRQTALETYSEVDPSWAETFGKVALTGEPARFEKWFGATGRWFAVSAFQTEYGRFGVLFTDITGRKQTEEVARIAHERLVATVALAPVGITIMNAQGAIVQVNDAVRSMWGGSAPLSRSSEEYVQYKGWWPDTDQALTPEDWPASHILETGRSVHAQPIDIERFDGLRGTLLFSGVALPGEHGEIAGAVIVTEDITARMRTEAALQKTNDELRYFIYALTHDLREPLRMVVNYTQLLARECEGKLSDEAPQFMAYAVEGARRIESLHQALLDYWEITERSDQTTSPVDSNAALSATLLTLQAEIQQSGATVTSDVLPTVVTEATMLERVFQNLIGNSIKYRGEAPPRIHITAMRTAKNWTFSVGDNGVGIDPEHAKAVFGMFKRLHGSEIPGTGIGLALCKKMVERGGGRIWVESEAGQGTAFKFTIPA